MTSDKRALLMTIPLESIQPASDLRVLIQQITNELVKFLLPSGPSRGRKNENLERDTQWLYWWKWRGKQLWDIANEVFGDELRYMEVSCAAKKIIRCSPTRLPIGNSRPKFMTMTRPWSSVHSSDMTARPGTPNPFHHTTAASSQRARIGALALHSRHDGRAITANARAAFLDRFHRQVDPDGRLSPAERERRAAFARRAYFRARPSSRARRSRARCRWR